MNLHIPPIKMKHVVAGGVAEIVLVVRTPVLAVVASTLAVVVVYLTVRHDVLKVVEEENINRTLLYHKYYDAFQIMVDL